MTALLQSVAILALAIGQILVIRASRRAARPRPNPVHYLVTPPAGPCEARIHAGDRLDLACPGCGVVMGAHKRMGTSPEGPGTARGGADQDHA